MRAPADDLDAAWKSWEQDSALRATALDWISRASAPDFKPDEKFYRLMHRQPEESFKIILALVQLIETPQLFFNFAAGPLEDFLAVNGVAFMERIHRLAVCHERLRIALGGVSQGSLRKEIRHRVQALAEKPSQGWTLK